MTHRIRHQILDIELPREAGAVALQRRASRVFQEQVLPRLDEIFSRIAPEGRVVRIDRLDLDLGDIAETNWERDFVEKCVEKISQQVAEAAFDLSAEPRSETLSAAENAANIFRYFLETGLLPWYAKGMELSELEAILADSKALENPVLQRELRQMLQQKTGAIERLVWQFGQAFSEKVVALALGLPENWLAQVVQIRQSQTGQRLSDAAFILLAKQMLHREPEALKNTLPTPGWVAHIFAQLQGEQSVDAPKQGERQVTEPPTSSPKTGRPQTDQAATLPQPGLEKRPQQTPDKKASNISPDGILVENAGLVLLAAYLPTFFKNLNLELPSPQSPSPQSPVPSPKSPSPQFKAIHLLHYLATGQLQPEEPVLALPKILCGLTVDEAVPQEIEIAKAEKQAAEQLLQAVVRNWAVLKNTSPDGLRTSFLRREGLLSWEKNRQAWLLRVTQQGQDLLLEKLPWSYSVVKLPWMPAMLQVEW